MKKKIKFIGVLAIMLTSNLSFAQMQSKECLEMQERIKSFELKQSIAITFIDQAKKNKKQAIGYSIGMGVLTGASFLLTSKMKDGVLFSSCVAGFGTTIVLSKVLQRFKNVKRANDILFHD